MISYTANMVAKMMCSLYIKYSMNGFRILTSRYLRRINVNEITTNSYAFQVEMLYRLTQYGFDICEVPITFVDRKESKSKLNLNEIFKFLSMCTRIMFRKQRF